MIEQSPFSTPERVSLFGIQIDAVDMRGAVALLRGWLAETTAKCRYVVTPNVDHIVLLQENCWLQAAYRSASLVLADGWPVVFAARMLRSPLPERVAGSDLVLALFASATADQPLTVFLLGAAPTVGERAAKKIEQSYPHVRIVGTYSPPLGFESDAFENERVMRRVAAAIPDLLVIGLGAPKQEVWVHRHQDQLAAKVALCGGATIDFLAGTKRRAPLWMRRNHLEWLHRLLTEPRRLAGRYARDGWIFPQLMAREVLRQHPRKRESNR